MQKSVHLELLTQSTCLASCGHCQYGQSVPVSNYDLDNMRNAYSQLYSLGLANEIGVAGGESLAALGFIEGHSVSTFWPTLQGTGTASSIINAGVMDRFEQVLAKEKSVLIDPTLKTPLHIGIKVVDDLGSKRGDVQSGVAHCVNDLLKNIARVPEFTKLTLRLGVNDLPNRVSKTFFSSRVCILSDIYEKFIHIPGLSTYLSYSRENPGLFGAVLKFYAGNVEIVLGMRYIQPYNKDQDSKKTEMDILNHPSLPIMLTPREVRFYHSTHNINDPIYSVSYPQFSFLVNSAGGSKQRFIRACNKLIKERIRMRDSIKSSSNSGSRVIKIVSG